jgi:hypothetical protein
VYSPKFRKVGSGPLSERKRSPCVPRRQFLAHGGELMWRLSHHIARAIAVTPIMTLASAMPGGAQSKPRVVGTWSDWDSFRVSKCLACLSRRCWRCQWPTACQLFANASVCGHHPWFNKRGRGGFWGPPPLLWRAVPLPGSHLACSAGGDGSSMGAEEFCREGREPGWRRRLHGAGRGSVTTRCR